MTHSSTKAPNRCLVMSVSYSALVYLFTCVLVISCKFVMSILLHCSKPESICPLYNTFQRPEATFPNMSWLWNISKVIIDKLELEWMHKCLNCWMVSFTNIYDFIFIFFGDDLAFTHLRWASAKHIHFSVLTHHTEYQYVQGSRVHADNNMVWRKSETCLTFINVIW